MKQSMHMLETLIEGERWIEVLVKINTGEYQYAKFGLGRFLNALSYCMEPIEEQSIWDRYRN